MLSYQEALANAAKTKSWPQGMCDNFVANMYGYTASGYHTAQEHWDLTPATDKHPGDSDSPAGSLVFWSGGSQGYGHVALSDGTEHVWSTDIGGPGTVTLVPVSEIEESWGLTYLGWALPVFQDSAPATVGGFELLHGVDVASYQGATPDFSGCQVVAIKVTEGTGYVNPDWESQLADARSHGCRIVFYHYPHISNGAQNELHFFLTTVGPKLVNNDVLCLDWEWYGQNVSDQQARDYKDAWVTYCKNARKNKCIVYSDRNNWLTVDVNSNCGDGLWIADYVSGGPRIKHPWVGWQYSSSPEDEDTWNFSSVADFDKWATANFQGVPVSTPPPVDVTKEVGFGVWAYKNPDPGPDAWSKLNDVQTLCHELVDMVKTLQSDVSAIKAAQEADKT